MLSLSSEWGHGCRRCIPVAQGCRAGIHTGCSWHLVSTANPHESLYQVDEDGPLEVGIPFPSGAVSVEQYCFSPLDPAENHQLQKLLFMTMSIRDRHPPGVFHDDHGKHFRRDRDPRSGYDADDA
jgi:hypothetical protein